MSWIEIEIYREGGIERERKLFSERETCPKERVFMSERERERARAREREIVYVPVGDTM